MGLVLIKMLQPTRTEGSTAQSGNATTSCGMPYHAILVQHLGPLLLKMTSTEVWFSKAKVDILSI